MSTFEILKLISYYKSENKQTEVYEALDYIQGIILWDNTEKTSKVGELNDKS